MARSKWKFNYFSKNIWKLLFLKKFYKQVKIQNKYLFNRSSSIPKSFINNNFYIYKGNMFKQFFVNKYSIFFKFGEFSFTRKPFKFPYVKKKKR